MLRITVLGFALILSVAQTYSAQAEYPKQEGLHARQGIDIIPEPQIVRSSDGDFVVDASTVIYADRQLKDLSPVTSLQEGLAETLHLQIAKSESDSLRDPVSHNNVVGC